MTAGIRVALMATMLGVVGMMACSDATGLGATYPTTTDTLQLYTLNSAPAGAPNAVYLYGRQIVGTTGVRAGSSFGFDVTFDIAANGQVTLYPVRRISSALAVSHQVGLQTVPGSFEGLGKAPSGGYTYDSTKVISAGQVVAIEASNPSACAYSYNGVNMYGKLIVDSVHVSEGKLFARLTVDPNCGFRSFASGTPKD